MDDVWKNGLPNATIISDRWAAQLKIISKNHQICLAHLLRDLIFLEESEKHTFASEFKQLLFDVFDIRKNIVKNKKPCQSNSNEATFLDKAYSDKELAKKMQKNYNRLLTPVKRIKGTPAIIQQFEPALNNLFSRAVSKIRQPIESFFNRINEKTAIQIASKVRSSADLIVHLYGKIAPDLCIGLKF